MFGYLPSWHKILKAIFFVKHLYSKHFHTAIFKTTLHPFFFFNNLPEMY